MGRGDRTEVLAPAGLVEPDSTSATACLHCGLDVPRSRLARGNQFCCSGCDHVYRLIHDAGFQQYYQLRPGRGVPAPGLREDALAWLEPLLAAPPSPDGLLHLSLDLQGVHCAACVWLLQQLFERRPGAVRLRINPARGTAELIWDPGRGDVREYLADAVQFGYRFGPRSGRAPARSNGTLVRIGICAAAAMNVMIFSLCYYFGLSAGDGRIYRFLGHVSLLLTAVAAVVGGQVFFRSAWQGLRRGLVHLDLPIALGILLAFTGSVLAYFLWGPERAYFDTVAIFVTLMLVGRWLQERIVERNRLSVLSTEGLEGFYVRRVLRSVDGADRIETVPAGLVQADDVLLMVPGDLVPVAGILQEGQPVLSLEWITGESELVEGVRAVEIPAGAFHAGRSPFRMVAKEAFGQSRVHDLLSGPIATERQSREERWWSRASTGYVVAVLLLAAAGFARWVGQDLTLALEVTIAILVVTCPCAIGLAGPLAQELTLLALKRRGVFVRSRSLLARALSVRKVFFDKTGTLTLGRLALDRVSLDGLAALDAFDRNVLEGMALRSNHPRSRAVVLGLGSCTDASAADPAGTDAVPADAVPADAVLESIGEGLELTVPDRGVYRLGRPDYVLGASGAILGREFTVFGRDGVLLAALSFDEELRGDAAEEIGRLRALGLEIELLSGDSVERTQRVAAQLGLSPECARGGLAPEEKSARVRERDDSDTIMVGDGLNDAAGLSEAFVAGTPAVDHPSLPARADFYFLGEGIAAVRLVLAAASRLRSVVRTNLAIGVIYNAVVLGFCFGGKVGPVSAAVLMPISSIGLVLLTVYRMRGREASWTS